MKVCSECRKCYDDSVSECVSEEHGTLNNTIAGDCELVKGYEIETLIESDSPVKIFRATHLNSQEVVIIKVINEEESASVLRDELLRYTNINHPTLAKVFEFGQLKNKNVYIVVEDLTGKTLQQFLLDNENLKESEAITIARKIAEAIEQTHLVGQIYRNINPKHIYISKEEDNSLSIKIDTPDFCGKIEKKVVLNANSLKADTELYEYFSPQQFIGNDIDFKTDLYSLAVVFYEMLLAKTPYELLSPQSIKDFIFNEDDLEVLDHDLRALIAYTLRESLHQRLDIRPHTTNKLVRQLRHLELIASPPETIFKEEVSDEARLTDKLTNREKLIEELRSTIGNDELNSKMVAKYEKVVMSERERDLEQVYVHPKNTNDIFEVPSEENEYQNQIDLIDENGKDYLPIAPVNVSTSPNSYTFKKSHVYITSTLLTLLFGSLCFATLYNLQSDAASKKVSLPEKEERDKKETSKPRLRETIEVVETEKSKDIDNKNKPSIELNSRELFEAERAELPALTGVQRKVIQNKVVQKVRKSNKKAKPIEVKQSIEKKTSEKLVFKNKVIIIGDKQKNKSKKGNLKTFKSGKNSAKVFSDVVITY